MSWYAIILMGSLVPLTGVTAVKSDIITRITSESWISSEHFATMLQVTFNASKCCNVQISGQSALTDNLLNDFVRIYPFEYTLNERNLDCDGYLTISTSSEGLLTELEKVPTTIATIEILYIVDENIEETSRLFNVSLYGNAKVNIAARNSLWTLSENYLDPRMFKKVSSHPKMMDKQGAVNFKGRELQAAAFFNPPFCYLLTTVNRTYKGIEGEFFIAKNKTEVDGVEMKIFMLIAQRLNFTWTVRRPNNGYRYGRRNETGWHGGMLGQIVTKEVDIAFSNLWIKKDHYDFVKLSTPVSLQRIHFLVPRPKPYPSFWALTRPLSPQVWIVIFAMLVVQSVYVYTKAWLSSRVSKRYRSFARTWTELLGRLVGECEPNNIQGFRLQFQLWQVAGVLLMTAYSSSLAARLTNPTYEKRIDTIKDLSASTLTWGREVIDPVFSDYFNLTDPWAKRLIARYQREKNGKERHEKILRGNYAIIGRFVGSIFFPEYYVSRKDLAGYRVMKEELFRFNSAFAVQPWLLKPVNKVLSRMIEVGLVDYHLSDVLHRNSGSALRELGIEHDVYEKSAKVLQLTPLGAGFTFLVVGLVVSTFAFLCELKSVAGGKSIREVLLDIKKNRQSWRINEQLERRRHQTAPKVLKRSSKRGDSRITTCLNETKLSSKRFKCNKNQTKLVTRIDAILTLRGVSKKAKTTMEGTQ